MPSADADVRASQPIVVVPRVQDWGLAGERPSAGAIDEAVQLVLRR